MFKRPFPPLFIAYSVTHGQSTENTRILKIKTIFPHHGFTGAILSWYFHGYSILATKIAKINSVLWYWNSDWRQK